MIQRKIKAKASLWPMLSNPEKYSFIPSHVSMHHRQMVYGLALTVDKRLAQRHHGSSVCNEKRRCSRPASDHFLIF